MERPQSDGRGEQTRGTRAETREGTSFQDGSPSCDVPYLGMVIRSAGGEVLSIGAEAHEPGFRSQAVQLDDFCIVGHLPHTDVSLAVTASVPLKRGIKRNSGTTRGIALPALGQGQVCQVQAGNRLVTQFQKGFWGQL